MFRRTIAGLILGPALLIGSFAWWGFLAQRTVLDESRTQTIAEELLDNEKVVEQIGNNVGSALEAAVPDSIPLTEEQVAAAVDVIMADPVVRDLIINSLGTTHRAFLGLDEAPAEIDLGPALASSRERIAESNEDIASAIPESFSIELPTERIPDASPVKSFLDRVVPLLAGVSVLMALMAFLTTSDRSHVLGKAARWAIGTTAFYLIVGLGIPFLLRQFAPDGAEVLAALLTAVLRAALIPSIVLGIIGAVLLLLSMFWPDKDRAPREATPRQGPEPRPTPAAQPVRQAQPAPRPTPQPPLARRPAPAQRPATQRRPAPSDDATTAMAVTPPRAVPPVSTPPPTTPPPLIVPPAMPSPRPAQPARRAPAPAPTAPARPTLPTRAKPPESSDLPSWTGETPAPAPAAASEPVTETKPKWMPPTWVPDHGWVMDPDDPRDPPNNAHFVEDVGWVVPGPPPAGA